MRRLDHQFQIIVTHDNVNIQMDVYSKGRYNIKEVPFIFLWKLWVSITEDLCDPVQEERGKVIEIQAE